MSVWENIYAASQDIWVNPGRGERLDGYEDHSAQLTADAIERGFRTLPRRLGRAPDPGDQLRCGAFTGVDWATQLGIVRDSWAIRDTIDMMWSEDLKACFAYPHLPASVCNKAPPLREARLARVWAEGRAAKCARAADFPDSPFVKVVPAVAISYYSNKFKTNGRHAFQNYIHHFGPGVFLYTSAPRKGGPAVIMMRGGKLRLTSHGIAG